jgi:hypothetical protein
VPSTHGMPLLHDVCTVLGGGSGSSRGSASRAHTQECQLTGAGVCQHTAVAGVVRFASRSTVRTHTDAASHQSQSGLVAHAVQLLSVLQSAGQDKPTCKGRTRPADVRSRLCAELQNLATRVSRVRT